MPANAAIVTSTVTYVVTFEIEAIASANGQPDSPCSNTEEQVSLATYVQDILAGGGAAPSEAQLQEYISAASGQNAPSCLSQLQVCLRIPSHSISSSDTITRAPSI